MQASHEAHKTHTKITREMLKEWEEDNLFYLGAPAVINWKLKTIFAASCEQNTSLNTYQLIDIFEFLHTFHHDSKEYQQTMEALHDAFIFDGIAFLPTIMTITAEDRAKCLTLEADRLAFIMLRFAILSESSIIRELKIYQEALDLMMEFGRMTPYGLIQARTELICRYDFTEFPNEKTLSSVKEKGFRDTFIFLFLGSNVDFYQKIQASPQVVALASCFNILQNQEDCMWKYNILNMRLLGDYPEKAVDLYRIFSKIYCEISKHMAIDITKNTALYSEETYQKIMHPAVLNNLALLKKIDENPTSHSQVSRNYMFHTTFDINTKYMQWFKELNALMDGIIAYDLFYQISPCLMAHLPKDMVREIFYRFLLVTQAVPVNDFVPRLTYEEKRILFPLSDSMIDKLDEEDVHDIKQTFSYFFVNKFQIFNKLSAKGMQLLLKKLGENFVQENLFPLNYRMVDLFNQMSLDSQKELCIYLGSDYIWSRMTDRGKIPYAMLGNLDKDQFALLMSMIDPLKYLTEYVVKYMHLQECYHFLGKINEWNKALYGQALQKLGREWLLESNEIAMDMTCHPTMLDMDTQASLIEQMDNIHTQKRIHSSEKEDPALDNPDEETPGVQLSASRDSLFARPNPANANQEGAPLYENRVTW